MLLASGWDMPHTLVIVSDSSSKTLSLLRPVPAVRLIVELAQFYVKKSL